MYLTSLGSFSDVHSPNFGGQSVVDELGRRVSAVEIVPATMHYADVVPEVAGTFPLFCDVSDHSLKGK